MKLHFIFYTIAGKQVKIYIYNQPSPSLPPHQHSFQRQPPPPQNHKI